MVSHSLVDSIHDVGHSALISKVALGCQSDSLGYHIKYNKSLILQKYSLCGPYEMHFFASLTGGKMCKFHPE